MKAIFIRMLTIVSGMLIAITMPAQELSHISQDPGVRHGVCPNGLSYYVASNPSSKGTADFALIQRDYDGNEKVLSIDNVLVTSESVQDSTLLVLMKKVESDGKPAEQAVVVCGDVDAASVITCIRYMSLMVGSSGSSSIPEYAWEGDCTVRQSCMQDTLGGFSTVRFEWNAPGTPPEYMNTVQAVIYEKTVREFGDVLCRWIMRELRCRDVPVAGVVFRHYDRLDGLDHETFVLEATVAQEHQDMVARDIMSILASLDQGKVSDTDFLLAEQDYILSLEKAAGRNLRDNSEYMQMCVDAFLYNGPLGSEKERLDFLMSKNVSEKTRKEIFAGISSALISLDGQHDTIAELPSEIMLSDTLALPGAGLKLKVKSSRKDSFSGGVVWTFENGFKVIYKRMPTSRTLYYSMSLNSGFANVEDIERGEGAYMSDYIDNCWISGMKGADFKDLLKLAGMTMNTRVGLSKTVISGQVRDRNAHLMMKALLAVSNTSRPDTAAVSYYTRSERLRMDMLPGVDMREVIDSLMCPGYRYTSFKSAEGVREGTFSKAQQLFSNMTSKMNDGVLVVVGDMPETDLKKLLQMYVGGFKVRSVASRRPSMQYHPVSGWSRYSVEGESNAAVVAVSGIMPMTASNHFASEIAAMMLERRIVENFKERGISARLSHTRNIYPDERVSIYVVLDGTSDHEQAQEISDILSDLANNVDAEEMMICKEYMKNAYTLQMQTPYYWLRVIPLRHLEGKDFTSGCDAKIDSVSAEQVANVFRTLAKGAGVEYVIKKKQ